MFHFQSGNTLTIVRVVSQSFLCLLTFFPSEDNYTKLCTIEADFSGVPLLPQPTATGRGTFYRIRYDIILLFGMTELKAQIAWKENVSGSKFIFFLNKPL